MIKLYKGDCLIESDKIESGSVDLILTDLPYGTVTNAPKNWTVSNEKAHTWDIIIDTNEIMRIANRVLRKNGRMIMFAQDPFSTELKNKAIPNIPYSYSMIWEKNDFANALLSKKAPVNYYEDVLVFSKTHDFEGAHPLRIYSDKLREFTKYSRLRFTKALGHGGHQHFMEGNKESSQFALCTEKTYKELIEVFGIDKMDGFKTYTELRDIDKKYDSTFNLWEGKKYKSNILKYKKDYDGYHPTQKPVLLLEDLIKTFSNENDLVVDLTMGSGSTGVACVNTKRNFIGIEMDANYYNIAKKRVEEKKKKN